LAAGGTPNTIGAGGIRLTAIIRSAMSNPATAAVMAANSLFSAGARASQEPKGHSESAYAFLDRSASIPCASTRVLLDRWYSQLPVEARASIRVRFANADPGHHLGALWELYLHETFRRLGYEVDLDIGREDPDHPRPDFLLAQGGDGFYLEATAALGASVLGDQSSQARAAALREAIERVRAPNFFIGIDVGACGENTPGRRAVTDPLQQWLDGLDADAVIDEYETTQDVPRKMLSFDGWEVECKAFPVSPEHRDNPDHRVIGTYSEGFAVLDDATPLRRKLKRKAGRYDALELPYTVALLCAGDFADDKDIADALLGTTAIQFDPSTLATRAVRQLDGFWHGPNGPQNTSVSTVVTIPQLSWSSITAVEPTVWLNPWAARPLAAALPWRTHDIVQNGHITTREATRSPADLFELPERWPSEK
jgi:hypothetical protein